MVRLPGPVFSQPKAVPDPIGFAFATGAGCAPLPSTRSGWLAFLAISAVFPVAWSDPIVVVVVEDAVLFALAMVLLGRKTFIGRALLGLAYVDDDFEAASFPVALEDADRQEVDHTPDPDLESGVVKDFSLPVVDLESSAATLEAFKSRLDLVEGSFVCSNLPGSGLVATSTPLGAPTVGEPVSGRVILPGLPMMPRWPWPGGETGGGSTASIDDDRFREAVLKSLYAASSSGRTSGMES